jgi:outer membrane protein
VAEAVSQKHQVELDQNKVRRDAEKEVITLYSQCASAQNQLKSLKYANQVLAKNYQVHTKDYRLGLVSNLEVLQALSSHVENTRAIDLLNYDLKLNYLKLQIASSGQILNPVQ